MQKIYDLYDGFLQQIVYHWTGITVFRFLIWLNWSPTNKCLFKSESFMITRYLNAETRFVCKMTDKCIKVIFNRYFLKCIPKSHIFEISKNERSLILSVAIARDTIWFQFGSCFPTFTQTHSTSTQNLDLYRLRSLWNCSDVSYLAWQVRDYYCWDWLYLLLL